MTALDPSICCTMALTMARPSPVPECFVPSMAVTCGCGECERGGRGAGWGGGETLSQGLEEALCPSEARVRERVSARLHKGPPESGNLARLKAHPGVLYGDLPRRALRQGQRGREKDSRGAHSAKQAVYRLRTRICASVGVRMGVGIDIAL